MKKIIVLMVSIFYVFGTSTLFHVFAMGHTHDHSSHITIASHHTHDNHHHKNDMAMQMKVVCGDNTDCINICSLVESAKITRINSSYIFLLIGHYEYKSLSPFVPDEYLYASQVRYQGFTIQKPQFSIILLGVNKLTI